MSSDKKRKLPPKIKDMSIEEREIFLRKRKESESKALAVVLSLLENDVVSEKDFFAALCQITKYQYDDVTEERAIGKLCGYPLCSKNLPSKLPNQKYKISSKCNKVYDITDRKKYCSNACYMSSEFIKNQIPTSPLWYRENDDIPEFKLLSSNCKGVPGQELDLSLVGKLDVGDKKVNGGFNSLLDFAEASLSNFTEPNDKVELASVEVIEPNRELLKTQLDACGIIKIPENISVIDQLNDSSKTNADTPIDTKKVRVKTEEKPKKKPTKMSGSVIIGDVIERKVESRVDPFISAGESLQASKKIEEFKTTRVKKETRLNADEKVKRKSLKSISLTVIHVEKCLGEWFTLETLIVLFGENKVKQMVADKGDCIKEYLNNMACGLFYKSTSYDQYQQLCRKLNLLELEDRRYDINITAAKDTKPLPDYSMLKEENKMLDIKVRAFYKGRLDLPVQESMSEPIMVKSTEESVETDSRNEQILTNIPLVDRNAQNALRRKIVLTALNKVLPDLAQALGTSSREVSGEVRLIVATFNLQANNILFKPPQWSMIALIIIKLMSIRDVRLANSLEKEKANKHLQLLLMSYEQDGGYLDRLLSWLTDIDRLIDSSNTQLTIGAVH